uniref:Alpha-L-rhamnosidase C-terminal domain-containing protein n=1 Tax=Kwoniella bestiolae CBS 10118 TaxID=1296100 RepID=A0A1B9GFR2_9TREE|nr:hypothetical protein I302_01407 [Kwoniella bestiolae CBS 10118]OCF29894.1 hypothetical protein I302_01407 [Kwoniella bestiolae CBS 10118]
MQSKDSLRSFGTLWGSPVNNGRFIPCRVESAIGSVTHPESIVSNLVPQDRTDIQATTSLPKGSLTLDGKGSSVVFDYGVSVAGIAFFDVDSTDPGVEIQVTFSESREFLDRPSGDGPISYLAGPATYRNPILRPSAGINYLTEVQGGQRWQKLTLLTEGRVVLNSIGFIATISTVHPTRLPSTFSCSNKSYNHLWDAGARTMQLCTAAKGSTPPLWEITEQGALISATRAIKHRASFDWKAYTLAFDVLIHRAGCGWGVAMTNLQGYIFYVKSERLAHASISVFWGFTDEDAESVENIHLGTTQLPVPIVQDASISIRTCVSPNEIAVSIDGIEVHRISSSKFCFSPITQSTEPQGCFGFGPGADGLATYTNVLATSNLDGRTLYEDKMNTRSSLDDFGAGTTTLDCLLDGGKRDRVVWGGDAAIMGPPVAYSTYTLEALKGSVDLLMSYRGRDGRFAAQVPPTHPWLTPLSSDFSLSYELYLIQSIYDAWMFGAISDGQLAELFPSVEQQLKRVETFIDENGLIFCGPDHAHDAREFNYYDPPRIGHSTKLNAQYVSSLRQSVEFARSLGFNDAEKTYQSHADRTAEAINQRLWNEQIKAYGITSASPEVIAQDANVQCILAGVADADRSRLVLETLSRELSHPEGVLAFDRTSGYRQSISNFVSGWHLFAAFKAGSQFHAKEILDKTLVPPSLPDHPAFTGTLWELMLTDGSPGMGGFTSLAHGWATAATAVLPAYVVGIRPTAPCFRTFVVNPTKLGLSQASAVVTTPAGKITSEWNSKSDVFTLHVSAPQILRGTVDLSNWGFDCENEYLIQVNNGSKSPFRPEKAEAIHFIGEVSIIIVAQPVQ